MNLRSLRKPDLYHGRIGKTYFEGWYFKLVDAKMENSFALIPGVYFSPDPQYSHAFIQIVDGMAKTYRYERFPVKNFSASTKLFSLAVEDNRFGQDGIDINLDRESARLRGQVGFNGHLHWPDNFINPGSMGFYNYILKMQCYSQVCALDFDMSGSLNYNGKVIDFDGGRGYIEKNWGSAFPYSWVWVQCNHFERERASLSCSLAHIPFLFSSFRGFLIGLYVKDIFYEFSTINRSKAEVLQSGTDVTLRVMNKQYSLLIECETESDNYILLNGPRGDKMIPLVQENLQGLVHVELKEKATGKILFADNGRCAGVEYGGEQMLVVDA
jgi:tocopherol cyclase